MRNETLGAIVLAIIGLVVYAYIVTKNKQKVERENEKLLSMIDGNQVEKNLLLVENEELNATLRHFGLGKGSRRA